jgi:hypothetical protein
MPLLHQDFHVEVSENYDAVGLVLLSQKKRLIQKVAGEVLSESVTG